MAHPRIGQSRTLCPAPDLGPSEFAGRSYAAYRCVYIAALLVWLWAVETQRPDAPDLTGAAICLIGAAIILWAPRAV